MGRPKNVKPRKIPLQERARHTVDSIFEAASQVFSENGYDVTTDTIAERAGVSIGTLYQYFPNKDAVLFGLWERHFDKAEELVDQVMEDFLHHQEKGPGMTRVFIEYMIAIHLENPLLHRLFFDEMPRPVSIEKRIRSFEEKCSSNLETLIRMASGVRLKNLPVSSRIIYLTLERLVHHYALYNIEIMDREHFIEELCDMINRYIFQ